MMIFLSQYMILLEVKKQQDNHPRLIVLKLIFSWNHMFVEFSYGVDTKNTNGQKRHLERDIPVLLILMLRQNIFDSILHQKRRKIFFVLFLLVSELAM